MRRRYQGRLLSDAGAPTGTVPEGTALFAAIRALPSFVAAPAEIVAAVAAFNISLLVNDFFIMPLLEMIEIDNSPGLK
jgi:hypothetical protein